MRKRRCLVWMLLLAVLIGCGAGSEEGNRDVSGGGNPGNEVNIDFEPEGNMVAGNRVPMHVTVEGGNIPSVRFSLTKGKGVIEDPNTLHPVICPDEVGEYCVRANVEGDSLSKSKCFWVSAFQASCSPTDGSLNVPRNADLILTSNGNNVSWDVYAWNEQGSPLITPKLGITGQVIDLGILPKNARISYQAVAHNGTVIFLVKSASGEEVCRFSTALDNSPPYITNIGIKGGGGTYLVEGDEPELAITASDVDPNDVILYTTSLMSSPAGSEVHIENAQTSNPKIKGVTKTGEYRFSIVVENPIYGIDYQRDYGFEMAPIAINNFSPDPNTLVSLRPTISFSANATGNAVLWLSKSHGVDFSTNAVQFNLGQATSYSFAEDLESGMTYYARILYTHGTVTKWFPSSDTEWHFSTVPPEPINHTPVITNVTASKTEFPVGEQITLQVVASDVDGDTLKYTWLLDPNSPNKSGVFTDPAKAETKFSASAAGTCLIMCQVGDSKAIAQRSLLVTVRAAATNHRPISVITMEGDPNRYFYPGDVVRVNGRLSSDLDNDPLTHRWDLSAKPTNSTAVIANPNCVDAAMTVDLQGTYVIQYKAWDGKEWSESTQLILQVQQAVEQVYLRNFKPAYNDANVPVTTTAIWESNGTNFDIYFSEDPNRLVLVSSKQTTKSYTFQGLQKGKIYYYQVAAYKTAQATTPVWGPVIRFTTVFPPPEVTEWKGESVTLTKSGKLTFNNIYSYFPANAQAALDRRQNQQGNATIQMVGDIIGWGGGLEVEMQDYPRGIQVDLAKLQQGLVSRGQSLFHGPNRTNFVVVENGSVVGWLELHRMPAADRALFVRQTAANSSSGAGDPVFTWDFYEPTGGTFQFGPIQAGESVTAH